MRVIHGKGMGSPDKLPVLKGKVRSWLVQKEEVIAFVQARESLGGAGACGTTTQNAINGAVARGTVVVVAAGNANTDAGQFTPANCANVITVAATNRQGARASYSNYGALVDVSAPGGEA